MDRQSNQYGDADIASFLPPDAAQQPQANCDADPTPSYPASDQVSD